MSGTQVVRPTSRIAIRQTDIPVHHTAGRVLHIVTFTDQILVDPITHLRDSVTSQPCNNLVLTLPNKF
jgi:hypothetical protein